MKTEEDAVNATKSFHSVRHCGTFVGLKGAKFGGLKCILALFCNCSDCFVVILFSFYFLSALQTDSNSNTVAWAYMTLIQVQNIFLPKNIVTIVLLAIKTVLDQCFAGISREFQNGPFDPTILAQNITPNIYISYLGT